MYERRGNAWRRNTRRMLAGLALSAGAITIATSSADAATSASFNRTTGVLTVSGDSAQNTITISRNAAGRILVNGGAISIGGGTPTVANTARIDVFGLGGSDRLTLDEVNGALPRASLFGGTGGDSLTGGSSDDSLFGQGGADTLLGKGGTDRLFGGGANDTLTGGDADDIARGQGGDDRMIWNPGDDTDLNEGGVGSDTVEVNGGGGLEQFTVTANGARVRFDRLNPAPFSIDIGTSENLVLNANGGDDEFSATGNLAALIRITVDGGAGNDTLLGSNGIDVLLGGDGNDVVDGQQANDIGFLGAGDDTFQWDPGDGSDVVEGQAGTDRLLFNGSAGDEIMEALANGGRVLFTRNLGNIVMDLDDVETIDANAFGGADLITVRDLSGTDVVDVRADLAGQTGGTDGQADNVVVEATNGEDVATVTGQGAQLSVQGLPTRVLVTDGVVGQDRLTVNALASDDVIDASGVPAGTANLTLNGGVGDDVLLGSEGDDVLLGEAGDDVLLGGAGNDVLDGGDGDDVEIQSFQAGQRWLAANAEMLS